MKLKSRLFFGYLAIVVVYAALALIPSPSAALLAQLHTTASHVRVAAATLIAVIAAIWFIGFYSYSKFCRYASLIRGTADGKPAVQLKRGLLLMALWGPVNSITSSALNYLTLRHIVSASATTIIAHYVGMIMPLAAYVYISIGARGLSRLSKQRPSFLASNIITLLVIYISVIYIRLIFTAHHRYQIFHESGWLIMLTLAAPYIYMWFIGIVAAYELFLYSRKSPGLVYRKLWRLLALGFAWLIAGTIVLQFVSTGPLLRSSLNATLLVVYALVALLSVGFILIALGTAKLQKIEEA